MYSVLVSIARVQFHAHAGLDSCWCLPRSAELMSHAGLPSSTSASGSAALVVNMETCREVVEARGHRPWDMVMNLAVPRTAALCGCKSSERRFCTLISQKCTKSGYVFAEDLYAFLRGSRGRAVLALVHYHRHQGVQIQPRPEIARDWSHNDHRKEIVVTASGFGAAMLSLCFAAIVAVQNSYNRTLAQTTELTGVYGAQSPPCACAMCPVLTARVRLLVVLEKGVPDGTAAHLCLGH